MSSIASSFPAPDISQTTISFEQQMYQLTAQVTMRQRNADNQTIYDSAVRDYNANMSSGQPTTSLRVPVAPLSYIISAPDANGLVYATQTGPPLTPTPPLTVTTVDNSKLTVATPIQNHLSIDWAAWRPGNPWVPANKDDGWPNALTTPPIAAPDGTMHTYERFSTPFGALYLQVS